MSGRVAFIAGSGGVLGEALMREFETGGYRVAGLRRNPIDASREVACDFSDPSSTQRAFALLEASYGVPDVLVFNAGHVAIAPFLELDAATFETCWSAGVRGAAASARAVLPGMLHRGSGVLLFTGATGSLRGSARFAAMAAGKFALRGFAQALAREYQDQGIHVAHVVLDGVLRGSDAARRFGKNEHLLEAAAVASSYRWLAQQPQHAWTQEIDLRPAGEKF